MNRKILFPLLILAALLAGCSKAPAAPETEPAPETTAATESPYTDAAAELMQQYLTACKDASPDASAAFLIRDHRDPYVPLLSFTVHSQKALNPELWVFSVQQQTEQQICSQSIFVGLTNGTLAVFPEIEEVPDALCYGFQPANYVIPKETAAPKEAAPADEVPSETAAETAAPAETTAQAESSPQSGTNAAAPTGTVSAGSSSGSSAPAAPSGSGSQSPSSIPTGDHDFKVDVQFNCLTGGTKTYTCKKCGYTFQTNAEPLGEHTFCPGTGSFVQATCTEGGYFLIKCQNCPEYGRFPDPDHPARGHQWVRTLRTDASGTYYVNYCEGCKTSDLSTTEYLYHADTFQPGPGESAAPGSGTPEDSSPSVSETQD